MDHLTAQQVRHVGKGECQLRMVGAQSVLLHFESLLVQCRCVFILTLYGSIEQASILYRFVGFWTFTPGVVLFGTASTVYHNSP